MFVSTRTDAISFCSALFSEFGSSMESFLLMVLFSGTMYSFQINIM